MNDKTAERAAKVITALLFVVSVTMFILCFVVQPHILAKMETPVSAARPVENTPVRLSEPVKPEIVTLVEVYEPVVPEATEAVVEPVIEDLEADPIPVIEGEVELPNVVYFDVPLDEDLQDHIFATCEEYGVDPALVIAVIERESQFVVDAVGDYGRSLGLMQVQPQWFAVQMAEHGFDNLLDPYQNIVIGVEYLSDLMAEGKGDTWALMAYNGGPSYANSMGGWVSEYATTVMAKWAEYAEYLED